MRTGFRGSAISLVALLLLSSAGRPSERGAAALDQALRDLSSDLRVACLAAHPDDEDAETLALLRMRHGVETTVVCFTRGEGGQNEIGPELYEALGAIRTRETRAAAEVIGARVRFLDFPDFGYSRSAEETFLRWGREEVVSRLTRALREIRPHVVITNHDVEGGHGHHQAVGRAALEAFDAAADPGRFPRAGAPWQVRKLFVACSPEAATARPDTGAVDPVRGLSYAEIGKASLLMHRSQGTWDWVKIPAGPRVRPYRFVLSRVEGGEKTLLGGLPVARPEWLSEERRSGTRAEILARILEAAAAPEERRPPAEKIDRAVAAALGLTLSLELGDRVLVPGERTAVHAVLRNGGEARVLLKALAWSGIAGPGGGAREVTLEPGAALAEEIEIVIPAESAPNRPLRDHLHDYPRPRDLFAATVSFALEGVERTFSISRDVEIPVFPPITMMVGPWGRLFRPVEGLGAMRVLLTNHSPAPIRGALRVSFDTDRLAARFPDTVEVPPGSPITLEVVVEPRGEVEPREYPLDLRFGGTRIEERLRVMDVEIPEEVKIGVVTTYGDEHLRALEAMDIEPVSLSDEDLEIADLSGLDTIVLGIRAYLARPVLRRVNHRLLSFVENGGNLVVCYNKEREWSPAFAPYLLEIARDRVTREDAPVELTNRDHRLLTFPNQVEQKDFDGWVQERGLYFPSRWDEDRYEALLRTADPGERLVPGILVAEHGKGTYIYTSLVWYRQLRILNPAALKVYANMVSYPWRR